VTAEGFHFDGERIDPRLVGVGLTAAEMELLACELVTLNPPTYAKLFSLGVHGPALTGQDAFDALHVAAVVFLPGSRFEFGHNLRDATGSVVAIIVPARDERGFTRDLVAWDMDTGQVATWQHSAMLGEHSLGEWRISDSDGLRVYPTMLEWLCADRDGLVIFHGSEARWRLIGERLIVDDAAFGLRLREALRLPEPEIFVRTAA
jgi:hypothetical protein